MNSQNFNLARMAKIIVTISTTGSRDKTDPTKRIVQCWTLDGDLIAELDYSKELMESFGLGFGD